MTGCVKTNRAAFTAVLACLPFLAASAGAQSVEITGRVFDAGTGEPVPSAQVLLVSLGRQTLTADDGSFALRGLSAGTRILETRRVGYAPRRDTLQLGDGQSLRVELALRVEATTLPPVAVEATPRRPHLGGFWDRRDRGMGIFFTRDEIERRRPFRITDMFQGLQGVTLTRTSRGRFLTFERGNRCVAAVFVNGAPFQMTDSGIDEIHPDDIEAIEIYSPSRVPVEFNRTAMPPMTTATHQVFGSPNCGVVAVWTRGGRR
jgi:hypothetical protein